MPTGEVRKERVRNGGDRGEMVVEGVVRRWSCKVVLVLGWRGQERVVR